MSVLGDLCLEIWLQFANFLRFSSSLGSHTGCVLQVLLDASSRVFRVQLLRPPRSALLQLGAD